MPVGRSGQRAGLKIGLALSGGFARGIAHIGVLKVLEQHRIPIHSIAGSSVGALIGAVFCGGMRASEMAEIACCTRPRHLARWTISKFGLFSSKRMVKFLDKVLKASTFEELAIPLAITATEISTGKPVVLRSGRLSDAIRASCAYPGVFPPVEASGQWLVDGALTHPVPTRPAQEMEPDRLIAVHLRTRAGLGGPRNMFDVIAKSLAIAQQQAGTLWRDEADLIVEPDVRPFRFNDFDRTPELLHAGETAMRSALPKVLRWLEDGRGSRDHAPAAGAFAQEAL